MRPMGLPARSAGRDCQAESSWEVKSEESDGDGVVVVVVLMGKVVTRVLREERCMILRAMTADSWTVGKWKGSSSSCLRDDGSC